MNRRTFFLGLTGLAGCTSGKPRLNVYNWSDYVAEDTIPNFEQEFGVSVRYSVFESNEEMLAKVMTGNSGWDIVFPSNYLIEPMREMGLLAPIQHQRLPNLASLSPEYQSPVWDPGLRWSVPYMLGASGILYRKSLSPAPDSWASLWDQRLSGRITMLDDPAEVIGAALMKLGLPLNATGSDQLVRGREAAIAQKPLLRAYLNAEVRDQVVAGDVLAAQLWTTTAAQAMAASEGLGFAYPREGFARYADNVVILAESQRAGLAHQLIDYLLRPQVAAAIVRTSRTATANGAAHALLPDDLRNDPALYPPESILARGQWFAPMPAAVQRLRDRIWTEIKAS